MKTVTLSLLLSCITSLAIVVGELPDTTPIDTILGEDGSAVELVSKAKLNLMLEAIAIGSEDVWMDLSGPTGLIYQIVRNTGVVGSRDKMIVTSVSVDFESFDHSISNGSVITADAYPMQYFWRGHFDEGSYGFLISSDQKTVTASFGNFFDAYFGVTSTSQLSAPYTLSAIGVAATGSFTVDWYGIQTNVYQIAVIEDVAIAATNAQTFATAAVIGHNADTNTTAHAGLFGLGTNWVTRTGLTGTNAFSNLSNRPQAWSGTGALTVSGFTGLTPPTPVYWTLQGFDSITLPSSVHFVGGGSWQTNMVNHFSVWLVGDEVMMSVLTATSIEE